MKTAYWHPTLKAYKRIIGIIAGLVCGAALANVDIQNPSNIADQPVELVLTLPQYWHPLRSAQYPPMQKVAAEDGEVYERSNGAKKGVAPVNVGCDIGVDETVLVSSSLTGRMEGNCRLNFHY